MMIGRIEARFPDSYRNGNVLMIHGDCMDVMAEIGEKEIQLAIVDPPYGININMNQGRRSGNEIKHERKKWDSCAPNIQYWKELSRVTKEQIVFGANNFLWIPPHNGWIVWDKDITGDVQFSKAELAYCSKSNTVDMVKIRAQTGAETYSNKIHPTQKPVALYKWLLTRYAKPAELILDTHGGSGSIVIACHELGHPIIWVEKDADYYRDAVARYKTHALQVVLFEPVEIMKEQKLFEV
jgi:site-specific DNA-methyltransferase (adenine-specific)